MGLNEALNEVDRAFESEQVPWLEGLVNQPSHTRAVDDVEAAASLIETFALNSGMNVERVPGNGFADHRVYSTPATRQNDRALLLAGHCDTVYPREQGFLTFQRDEDGDTIRGPGVLDMKSGLSVILFSLRALEQVAPDCFSSLKIRFVCNTDEEVGSPDSRTLYENLAEKTTAALVFEGGRTGDRIITGRKGTGGFRLEVQGREAHAGNQHADGINAIHALSLLIPRLEALTNYDKGTTVNVGIIRGGHSKNTVPAEARCDIDVRVSTGNGGRQIAGLLQEIADNPFTGLTDYPEKFANVSVSLKGRIARPPMEGNSESDALRERYETAAHPEGLGIGPAPLQGGGSDANLLAARGVPCIDGLGPFGKFMHSPKEWSSLSSLRRRTRALVRFLCEIGRAG